jgi:23S rRNA G2445 N2-methylase RlmL
MFVSCIPGLAPLVRLELAELPGVTVADVGFDGRSDIVFFEVHVGGVQAALSLRTPEDIFVEIGHTLRSHGDNPRWIAGRLWRPERVQKALCAWAEYSGSVSSDALTFHVIVRVLQEQSFLRSELRREFSKAINDDKPKWKAADPAQIEVWLCEFRPGRLAAGLRLSGARMRQHGGRKIERQGALRPTVAAAMVRLAGEASGILADPCCGSGTILTEGLARGWTVVGADISAAAVGTARHNAPQAALWVADALNIPLPNGSVAACVSNLPFGQQFGVQGEMRDWLRTALRDMSRVTRAGGGVVVLAPKISPGSVPHNLKLRETFPIRLLGAEATIWAYDRV